MGLAWSNNRARRARPGFREDAAVALGVLPPAYAAPAASAHDFSR